MPISETLQKLINDLFGGSQAAEGSNTCCAGADSVSVAREVDTIVEALRATREVATVTSGLKRFSKALRGENAAELLSAFLARSPRCEELHRLWDAPVMVRTVAGMGC